MKIAVVSDTHWQPERELPRVLQLLEAEKPDLILHAGDWTNLQLWGYLARIARTEGVAGNCDGAAIVAEMGLLRLLDVEDVKIGLMHGQLLAQRQSRQRGGRLLKALCGRWYLGIHIFPATVKRTVCFISTPARRRALWAR